MPSVHNIIATPSSRCIEIHVLQTSAHKWGLGQAFPNTKSGNHTYFHGIDVLQRSLKVQWSEHLLVIQALQALQALHKVVIIITPRLILDISDVKMWFKMYWEADWGFQTLAIDGIVCIRYLAYFVEEADGQALPVLHRGSCWKDVGH